MIRGGRIMIYGSIKPIKIESDEIRKLVSKTRDLTRGGYDLYD